MRRGAHGITRHGRQFYPAKRGEACTYGGGEVALPSWLTAESIAQNVTCLVLHRVAMNGGPNTQTGFQQIIEVTDGDSAQNALCHQ